MTVRVLIVDDQEPFRSVAREVVDATPDFEVVGEAETGEESMAMVALLSPDLVLMDVNLPGIDGVEATRKIRAGNNPPIVFLISTYETEDYSSRARKSGAATFIPKSDLDPGVLESSWAQAFS